MDSFKFLVLAFCVVEGGFSHQTSRASTFCPPNSQCVPISTCPLLRDLMRSDCVMSNKVNSLGCGYQGSGLVCCPQALPTTFREHKQVNGQVCGQSAVQGKNYQDIGSYPWVARIGFKNTESKQMKYPCTGSILNRRVILTAAHCALAKAEHFKIFSVRIGEYRTNSDIDCGAEFCGLPIQDIQISHIVVHPGYEKQSYRNNIALIVLQSAMNYSVTSQPICLPDAWSVSSGRALLVGWGKTAGQTAPGTIQQVLNLPILALQQCANLYGSTLPISEDHLCAGGEVGNDACSGFGGAPLIEHAADTYYQIGILSFGSDQCGAAGVPSVYTNVRKYLNWIRENIPLIYKD